MENHWSDYKTAFGKVVRTSDSWVVEEVVAHPDLPDKDQWTQRFLGARFSPPASAKPYYWVDLQVIGGLPSRLIDKAGRKRWTHNILPRLTDHSGLVPKGGHPYLAAEETNAAVDFIRGQMQGPNQDTKPEPIEVPISTSRVIYKPLHSIGAKAAQQDNTYWAILSHIYGVATKKEVNQAANGFSLPYPSAVPLTKEIREFASSYAKHLEGPWSAGEDARDFYENLAGRLPDSVDIVSVRKVYLQLVGTLGTKNLNMYLSPTAVIEKKKDEARPLTAKNLPPGIPKKGTDIAYNWYAGMAWAIVVQPKGKVIPAAVIYAVTPDQLEEAVRLAEIPEKDRDYYAPWADLMFMGQSCICQRSYGNTNGYETADPFYRRMSVEAWITNDLALYYNRHYPTAGIPLTKRLSDPNLVATLDQRLQRLKELNEKLT